MLDYNKLPKVSYIMILTRQNSKPQWVKEAMNAIKGQYYPNKEIVTIDNEKKDKSIGKCWNMAVKKATGTYCLFVGDDDKMTPEYTMSLVITILNRRAKGDEKYGVTSYLTLFDTEEQVAGQGKKYPTGMWDRQYLLTNKFDESLKKMIDTDFYKKHSEAALIASWHFGYFYRQHDNMVSGRNIKRESLRELKNKGKIDPKKAEK